MDNSGFRLKPAAGRMNQPAQARACFLASLYPRK